MLARRGEPVEKITTLTAALALPWAFKFLWAPLVDVLRGPRWSLRAWIVTSQLAMAATLVPLVVLEPDAALGSLFAASLLAHALCAATQDVSIDGLAIAATTEHEHGAINGWMNAGMLGGRALASGGGILLVERAGLPVAAGALIALLLASVALAPLYRDPSSLRARDPSAPRARDSSSSSARDPSLPRAADPSLPRAADPSLPRTAGGGSERRSANFGRHLRAALGRRSTWLALAFAATAGCGFEAVGGLVSPLLVARELPPEARAAFFAGPAVLAPIVGGLVGGRLSDRIGRRRGVLLCGLALNGAILGLAAVVRSGASDGTLLAALGVVWLAIGLFTASSYGLFMDLTDRRLGSTQFSAYMGATNLCEAWATRAGGVLAGRAGYPTAFGTLGLGALLALPLLAGMRGAAGRAAPPALRTGRDSG